METLTPIFRTTEEILSSSPGDLVSATAATLACRLRCAATFVAERIGANGFATMTTSTAH